MEDQILARAAAAGDQQAFVALVERYRRYVYTIAYRIVLHEEDALDVMQNVFLRVALKVGEWNGSGSFRAWIGTISSRAAIDHVRWGGRRETAVEPRKLERLAEQRAAARGDEGTTADDPVAALARQERLRLVEGAMGRLTPQQRAIFAMRLGEDLSTGEIAERMNLPAEQVRSQLSRAIARLRQHLMGKEV